MSNVVIVPNKQVEGTWIGVENMLNFTRIKKQYISIPNSTINFKPDLNKDWSVSFLACLSKHTGQTYANGANFQAIWSDINTISPFDGFDIRLSNNGESNSNHKRFIISFNASITTDSFQVSVGQFSPAALNKYTLVYTASTKLAQLYQGSNLIGSKTITATGTLINNRNPLIGNTPYGISQNVDADCLDGFIENIIWYNKALSTSEVSQCCSEIGIVPKSLRANVVAHYTLNHRSGKVAYDSVEQYNYAKKESFGPYYFTDTIPLIIEGSGGGVTSIQNSTLRITKSGGYSYGIRLWDAAKDYGKYTQFSFKIRRAAGAGIFEITTFLGTGGQAKYTLPTDGSWLSISETRYVLDSGQSSLIIERARTIGDGVVDGEYFEIDDLLLEPVNKRLTANHGELINYTDAETGITARSGNTVWTNHYTKLATNYINGSGIETKTGLPEITNALRVGELKILLKNGVITLMPQKGFLHFDTTINSISSKGLFILYNSANLVMRADMNSSGVVTALLGHISLGNISFTPPIGTPCGITYIWNHATSEYSIVLNGETVVTKTNSNGVAPNAWGYPINQFQTGFNDGGSGRGVDQHIARVIMGDYIPSKKQLLEYSNNTLFENKKYKSILYSVPAVTFLNNGVTKTTDYSGVIGDLTLHAYTANELNPAHADYAIYTLPELLQRRYKVRWGGTANVTVAGNSITMNVARTGPWMGMGYSKQSIISGDGYAEIEIQRNPANGNQDEFILGLASVSDAGTGVPSLDYGLFGYTVLSVYQVYENEVKRGGDYNTPAGLETGDRLRVAIESGVVKYYFRKYNTSIWTLIYTSTVAPTYPLVFSAYIDDQNTTIKNAIISGTNLSL